MRRVRVTWWVALLSLSLIAPAGFSFSTPETPECCRAAGKHRCSMRRPGQDGSGVSIRGVRECPNFLALRFAPVPAYSPIANAEWSGWNPLQPGAAAHAQVVALYHLNLDCAGQKRGPPAIFS